jgi:hypothetical protein
MNVETPRTRWSQPESLGRAGRPKRAFRPSVAVTIIVAVVVGNLLQRLSDNGLVRALIVAATVGIAYVLYGVVDSWWDKRKEHKAGRSET